MSEIIIIKYDNSTDEINTYSLTLLLKHININKNDYNISIVPSLYFFEPEIYLFILKFQKK
jgi:hypothetical protein